MKCYLVWFKDGTTVFVDAVSEIDATGRAILIHNAKIKRVECLILNPRLHHKERMTCITCGASLSSPYGVIKEESNGTG